MMFPETEADKLIRYYIRCEGGKDNFKRIPTLTEESMVRDIIRLRDILKKTMEAIPYYDFDPEEYEVPDWFE